MNQDILDQAITISNIQYMNLTEDTQAEFIGQTRVNEHNQYLMVWKIKDILYKTINIL